MDETINPLEFYAQPGIMTDPGDQADLFDGLPTEISELCQVVQNNLVHIFWAERYGLKLEEDQKRTVQVRPVSEKLAWMRQVDSRPLVESRSLDKRQVGNCRDFTVLLTAMLRHQGRPARARCGFGAYFMPNHFEDHWVCEVWDAAQDRWRLVDSQLDAFQRQVLGVEFNTLDVPYDQFILAGHAWQMCRRGQAVPDQFGIFEWNGVWFILGNVVRDVMALNKVEILPWDGGWGLLNHSLEDAAPQGEELEFWDRLAALELPENEDFAKIRAVYANEPGLHFPETLPQA